MAETLPSPHIPEVLLKELEGAGAPQEADAATGQSIEKLEPSSTSNCLAPVEQVGRPD